MVLIGCANNELKEVNISRKQARRSLLMGINIIIGGK
jgi:hypothetical protein